MILKAIPRTRTLCIVHREEWGHIGSEDITFAVHCFYCFFVCVSIVNIWGSHSPLLPSSNAVVALPDHKKSRTSDSSQWARIDQVPALWTALCRVGAVVALMHARAWACLAASTRDLPFSSVKTNWLLFLTSCTSFFCVPFCRGHGCMYWSMCSLTFSDSTSFDPPTVLH